MRGSRVITLIHRQESVSLLGIPLRRFIDVEDSEQVLRAIRLTPDTVPIDLVVHSPGGLVLAAEQIARALHRHPAKVTVIVPHYAMSGGTMLALAADEILMDENAVLGPVDPQIGQWPAASIIKVADTKPIERVNDETLILADLARKAQAQVKDFVMSVLLDDFPEERAEQIAGRADERASGRTTIRSRSRCSRRWACRCRPSCRRGVRADGPLPAGRAPASVGPVRAASLPRAAAAAPAAGRVGRAARFSARPTASQSPPSANAAGRLASSSLDGCAGRRRRALDRTAIGPAISLEAPVAVELSKSQLNGTSSISGRAKPAPVTSSLMRSGSASAKMPARRLGRRHRSRSTSASARSRPRVPSGAPDREAQPPAVARTRRVSARPRRDRPSACSPSGRSRRRPCRRQVHLLGVHHAELDVLEPSSSRACAPLDHPGRSRSRSAAVVADRAAAKPVSPAPAASSSTVGRAGVERRDQPLPTWRASHM